LSPYKESTTNCYLLLFFLLVYSSRNRSSVWSNVDTLACHENSRYRDSPTGREIRFPVENNQFVFYFIFPINSNNIPG
jgi:hypothetical protein